MSTDVLLYRYWPKLLFDTLLAYLRWQTAEPEQREMRAKEYGVLIALAQDAHGRPPDEWLPYQLSGAFETARNVVLQEGYWSYQGSDGVMRGLKEVQYTSETDQLATDPSYGLLYRYPLPEDYFKTHALFQPWDGYDCPINIRETTNDWSTDAPFFVARYVSTDVLDSSGWPELLRNTVLAYLRWQGDGDDGSAAGSPEHKILLERSKITGRTARAQEYALLLERAREAHSRPADDWLRFQLDGSFPTAVRRELERGRWRFALRVATLTETSDPLPPDLSTGDPEYSFAYRFILPNDLLRTVRVYYERGVGPHLSRADIPFAEIGGAYHADTTPVTVRYVSRLGLDSTKWTSHFRDAVLARLQYEDARNNPAMTQIAAAKLAMYKDAIREAERLDDARDRVVLRGSRFVAGRYGWHRSVEHSDFVPTAIGGPPIIDS
jgi:hypothetical protein